MTTNLREHIDSTDAAHSPRFRLGSLKAWRAAFLASVGHGMAACGGDLSPSLPDHLRCEDELPLQSSSGLWQCENGIIHRRASGGEPCIGCVSPSLNTARDECDSDADCPDGAPCALTKDLLGTRIVCGNAVTDVSAPYFACLGAVDACGADDQCPSHGTDPTGTTQSTACPVTFAIKSKSLS